MSRLIYARLDAGAALMPADPPIDIPPEEAGEVPEKGGPGDLPLPPGGALPEDLAMINALPQVAAARAAANLGPLTADDVFVRSFYILNDQPWNNGIFRIAPQALSVVPSLLARGIPVMVNHAKESGSDTPLGHWFRGLVAPQADGSTWAKARMYVDRIEANRSVMTKLTTGAISEVSAEVLFAGPVCSIDDEDLDWGHEHMPGEEYGDQGTAYGVFPKIEMLTEISLCWAGMIAGTRMAVPMARDSAISVEKFLEGLAAEHARRHRHLLTPEETLAAYFGGDKLGERDPLDEWLKGSPAP